MEPLHHCRDHPWPYQIRYFKYAKLAVVDNNLTYSTLIAVLCLCPEPRGSLCFSFFFNLFAYFVFCGQCDYLLVAGANWLLLSLVDNGLSETRRMLSKTSKFHWLWTILPLHIYLYILLMNARNVNILTLPIFSCVLGVTGMSLFLTKNLFIYFSKL